METVNPPVHERKGVPVEALTTVAHASDALFSAYELLSSKAFRMPLPEQNKLLTQTDVKKIAA